MSRIRGVSRLRRLVNRIEPSATAELRAVIADGAVQLQSGIRQGAPVDSGLTASMIEVSASRDGLAALIGPGAKGVKLAERKGGGSVFGAFFGRKVTLQARTRRRVTAFVRAYWAEFGTKGFKKRNIPPQAARPFIAPAFDAVRGALTGRAKAALRKALEAARSGAGSADG